MGYLLKNPSGRIVEIDDKRNWKEFLKKRGFDLATDEEEKIFRMKQGVEISDDILDVHFICPSQNHDGYGESSKHLEEATLEFGVRLNRNYNKQKIALVYNYPEAILASKSDVNILFSMFESTKLPKEWDKHLAKFDKILVPSKFCQKAFKKSGFESEVVNLGYDTKTFQYKAKDPDKEPFTFLHFNSFDHRKGWDLVFKAFNAEFKGENAELILKSTKNTTAMAIPRSQYPKIRVIKEAYSHKELAELIQSADCFVLPSRGEGFGIPPLEALASGTPVIIPNAHGFADFFTRKYFFEVEVKGEVPAVYSRYQGVDVGKMIECDIESLKRQMRFVYEHRSYAFDMAKQGSKWVKKNWNYKKTGGKLAKILLEVKPEVEVIDNRSEEEVEKIADENKVIFLTEDTVHITGGRYYSWWMATALMEAGFEVVIYTNREPVFLPEFEKYPQPELRIVENIDKVDVKGKIYVGSPIIGSVVACRLGEKYDKPTFVEVFDPFPMMEKYRGKHNWTGWEKLIPAMRNPRVKIIGLCKETLPWIKDWLNKKDDKVDEIYPCINDREREVSGELKKKDWVTYIGRLDHHKKLDHILDAIKPTDMELHIITSVDGINFPKMVSERGMEGRVFTHRFASDREKFEVIKQSKATINGAIFEGFGMWLTESLSCGVPCVCYDYPTFKEIEAFVEPESRNVYYAKHNDAEDLKRQLKRCLLQERFTKGTKKFDFPAMVERVREVFTIEPKIGVITICLNEDEYIGASIRSMMKQKNVAKVAVVEGCVELNKKQANKEGLSKDKTKTEILKVLKADKKGKVIYDAYGWASNKSELRNRALHLLGKGMDYIMVVDGDELWKKEDFNRLVEFIKMNQDVSVVWYPAYHFWKKPNLIATGGQWDKDLFRFFKYSDKTLHWNRHQTPVENIRGQSVTQLGREASLDTVHFYHYGYLKDGDKVRAKIDFYKRRDKDLDVKDTWTDWKKGGLTQPTHGGGGTSQFKKKHPIEVVKKWIN